MEFSGCLNDGDFGPGVQGCREDFDFTLKFEKIFLSMLPAAIFIALSIARTALLARWGKVVGGTWFQIVKVVRIPAPIACRGCN
jgi:ATP-binding cassette subfamily C (CFTR/MRP) protein 1